MFQELVDVGWLLSRHQELSSYVCPREEKIGDVEQIPASLGTSTLSVDLPSQAAVARSSPPSAACRWLPRKGRRGQEERDYLEDAFVLIYAADGRGW